MAFKFLFFAALVGISSGASYQPHQQQSAASPGQIAYALSQGYDQPGQVSQGYTTSSHPYVFSSSPNVQYSPQPQAQSYVGYKNIKSSPYRMKPRFAPTQQTSHSQQAPVAYAQYPQIPYTQHSGYQQAVQAPSIVYAQTPAAQHNSHYPTNFVSSLSGHPAQTAQVVYTPSTPYASAADYTHAQQQLAYTQDPNAAYAYQGSSYTQYPQAQASSYSTIRGQDEQSAHGSSPQYVYNYDYQNGKAQEDAVGDHSTLSYTLADASDVESPTSDYYQTPKGYVMSYEPLKTSHSSPKAFYYKKPVYSLSKSVKMHHAFYNKPH